MVYHNIQLSWITETPEQAELKRQKEEDYAKLWEKTFDKQWLMELLYWPNKSNDLSKANEEDIFGPNNRIDAPEYNDWFEITDKSEWKLEDIEKLFEKEKENPITPILKRIWEISWIKLWSKDVVEIYKHFEIEEWQDLLEALKISIEKSDLTHDVREMFNAIVEKIISDNWEQNKKELSTDLDQVEQIKQKKDNEAIKLLGENYIKFPWNNWESNLEKDLQLAFEITANKILFKKTISPRPKWLDYALDDIKSWDIEIKVLALIYIHSLVNTTQWAAWKKAEKLKWSIDANNSYREIIKKEYYDKKIEKLREELFNIDDENKKAEIKVIINKLEIYRDQNDSEEKLKDKDWEIPKSRWVVAWGKNDVSPEIYDESTV